MKYKEILRKVYNNGRTAQDLTREEQIEMLGIIADAITNMETTVSHAYTLLGIRFSLMTKQEQEREYNDLST